MEVKVSYKGKIKKAKDVDCLDLPSLKAWLLERHSDMPSESLLAYIPDRETGIYNIDSEETYQAMRAKHKKIRLFIDPSKEELDQAIASARSSTQSKQKQKKEQPLSKEEKPPVKEGQPQTKKERLEQSNPPLEMSSQAHQTDDYYVCRICSKKYPDGVRYRCLGCVDFDVCEVCFNKGDHLSQAPHYISNEQHEFVSIESKKQFESYDYRALIRLLLDADYKAREHYVKQPPITHTDIIKENKMFLYEMQSWEQQYERRVNNDINQWVQDFQKLKNKQVK